MFTTYLTLGFDHILDIKGYDHILFLIALAIIYRFGEWRKVVLLATAFSIGHSITLALAALDIYRPNAALIEFLIPCTILATALYNIIKGHLPDRNIKIHYGIAMAFGLIHGLGFSNYFRALMGSSQAVLKPLLGFNIGVEMGQIIIVLLILLVNYLAMNILKINQRWWVSIISVIIAVIVCFLIYQKLDPLLNLTQNG